MQTTNELSKLAWHDLQWCLQRCPVPVLAALKKWGSKLCVSGGYIRACIANEPVNDIDLFTTDKETALAVARAVSGVTVDDLIAMLPVSGRQFVRDAMARQVGDGEPMDYATAFKFIQSGYHSELKEPRVIHVTDNAYTVTNLRTTVQIIHRWTFDHPTKVLPSFDFTIARAGFWWEQMPTDADPKRGEWQGMCDPRFYADLASKRLIYCSPVRVEEAGGSLLRVLKFYQRGYRIPIDSFGAVIARLLGGVSGDNTLFWTGYAHGEAKMRPEAEVEAYRAQIFTGLLREVDPNIDPHHIAHLPAESASRTEIKKDEAGT